MTRGWQPAALRVAGGSLLCCVLLLSAGLRPSISGLSARILNSGDQAGSGQLAYQHSYAATTCTSATAVASTACTGSLLPTTSSATATDAITGTGTVPAARLTEQAQLTSCAPESLANARSAADPMLARNGLTYLGSADSPFASGGGSIALNGSTGYAADVISSTNPNPTGVLAGIGQLYAVGIWFKTSATTSAALLSFGANAYAGGGATDRVLSMNASGKLSVVVDTSGTTMGPTLTSYNDGHWHYAYLLFQASGSPVTVTTDFLYIDGGLTPVLIGAGLSTSTPYAGYWRVGYSPVPAGVGRFTGSLSNLTVFNGLGTALPTNASSLYGAASQTAYDTLVAGYGATQQWRFNDAGTATYPGPYPTLPAGTAPCDAVAVGWTLANPASCVTAPASTTAPCSTTATLTTLVAAGWVTIGAVAPSTTQTSTVTFTRNATYTSYPYLAGLLIAAPTSFRITGGTGAGWTATTTWSGGPSGSVFVL